ncbi:hypothetical protein [Lysinibacillus sp. G01H]|uniref:hypothetical protein n=1 Tax=Lysinibacillus sp. G01H TaxID=3026425 RepID=UPI00237EC09F|nr:hypothetical protein [Lysinibacillus sp. G01H]WDU80292.1 hypothetical protein PSR12_03825 [Lysinibacillus sp. G01H]
MTRLFGLYNPGTNLRMIQDAYRIMDYIERLESIEHDEGSSLERRQAAAKEKSYQVKDLEDLKSYMRNSKHDFTKLVYYKYIEGYSLEEVAQVLAHSYSYVAKIHASFTEYMKQPTEEPIVKPFANSEEFNKYLKQLRELINPEYETCCSHCGSTTTIPHELARKIFANESRRERVKNGR